MSTEPREEDPVQAPRDQSRHKIELDAECIGGKGSLQNSHLNSTQEAARKFLKSYTSFKDRFAGFEEIDSDEEVESLLVSLGISEERARELVAEEVDTEAMVEVALVPYTELDQSFGALESLLYEDVEDEALTRIDQSTMSLIIDIRSHIHHHARLCEQVLAITELTLNRFRANSEIVQKAAIDLKREFDSAEIEVRKKVLEFLNCTRSTD